MASANEIIAPKAKNCDHIPRSIKTSPNFTAHTGPDSQESSCCTSLPLPEKKLAHNDHNLSKVITP